MGAGRAAEQLCVLGQVVHPPVLRSQPAMSVLALKAHGGILLTP